MRSPALCVGLPGNDLFLVIVPLPAWRQEGARSDQTLEASFSEIADTLVLTSMGPFLPFFSGFF